MNHSKRCWTCKEREIREKRCQAKQKTLDEAKGRGMVQLHSCISNIHDPMPVSCGCRKLITFAEAENYIRVGRAVDFLTRSANFFQRAVVERSRHKNPPVSSLGQKIAIERQIARPDLSEKDIVRMQAVAEEDKRQRSIEQDCKIEIEHELGVEALTKITRLYTDEEWRELERTSSLHCTFNDGIGHDERTLGGTGINKQAEHVNLHDDIEEQYATTINEQTDTDPDSEPTSSEVCDTESEVEIDTDQEEVEEECEEAV